MDRGQYEEVQHQESLEDEVRRLREENSKLKEQIKGLKNQVSRAGWQYEKDHADDWRKPIEMGML